MATHSRILAWKIHGQRRLTGYSSRGHKELDTAEATIVVQSLTWTQHTRLPLLVLLFRCSAVSDSAIAWTAASPASPVLHHLPELAQTHVCLVSDAIQPSHLPFLLLSIFPSIGAQSGGQSIRASASDQFFQ